MKKWLLAACLVAACAPRLPERRFPGAPVILISVDTLRSDHLPAYGYRGVATPSLDAFRRDAILFTRAWSHVPLTLPSHVSILTGSLPPEHQVRNNIGFRLRADAETLPAALRRAGYAAGGAVSSYVLRGSTGLGASFDFYDDVPAEVEQRSGARTVAAALPWIERNAARPFFFFLHVYEPHAPYTPPEPFRSQYRNPYDGEIAAADAAVGTFLDALKKSGVYDRAIIVFLSDHGEGLGDHGEEEHGIFLYREALQVPLLLKLPKSQRGGTTVDRDATLAEVAPTLAALAGVPFGRNADLLTGLAPRDVYSETEYPRLQLGWHELASLIRGDRHLIAGRNTELYDVRRDPAERRELAAAERPMAVSMHLALAAMQRNTAAPQPVDPETARKLAALGYVGSSRAPAADLPDAREAIASLPAIRAAYSASTARDWPLAAQRWRSLAQAQPHNVDAWSHLGEALGWQNDVDGALTAYRNAISASGSAPSELPDAVGELPLDVAALLLRAGRVDEAQSHAEAGVDADPPRGHEILARCALAHGDVASADAQARAAGDAPAALLLRAEIASRRGDVQQASQLAGEAERRARAEGLESLPRLDYVRGDILARSDRPAESEAAYRRAVAQVPNDLDAWSNLAVVVALQGRSGDAQRIVDEMIARNPGPASRAQARRTMAVLRGGV
jgi:arylsulfatase A-like enzyme/predicted Zn-dependent protease